mgnify:CR=1 FL=1
MSGVLWEWRLPEANNEGTLPYEDQDDNDKVPLKNESQPTEYKDDQMERQYKMDRKTNWLISLHSYIYLITMILTYQLVSIVLL